MISVFIATSIDGYIADRNNGLEWLESVPNPDGNDMGYVSFMESVDALVMGRNTFETVAGFDIDWPYQKPVFVLTNTLREIPDTLEGKVHLISGELNDIIKELSNKGYTSLYIDGGRTIQRFLQADLVDEIIISTIPILLGGGTRLFGELEQHLGFELKESKIHLNQIVQSTYCRKR